MTLLNYENFPVRQIEICSAVKKENSKMKISFKKILLLGLSSLSDETINRGPFSI